MKRGRKPGKRVKKEILFARIKGENDAFIHKKWKAARKLANAKTGKKLTKSAWIDQHFDSLREKESEAA